MTMDYASMSVQTVGFLLLLLKLQEAAAGGCNNDDDDGLWCKYERANGRILLLLQKLQEAAMTNDDDELFKDVHANRGFSTALVEGTGACHSPATDYQVSGDAR